MFATICKEFTFDAAHQLPNHAGKCRHLHGHTYKVRVYLRGKVKPINGASDEGMVEDFSVVKEVFKRKIASVCDHKFLNETVPVPVTTAENLAGWMLQTLREELPSVVRVRVYETPTSYAEVSVADLEDGENV